MIIETQTFIGFLATSSLIVLAPGPAQAMVLARSISGGRKAGIMTALGLNVGTMFHAVAAGIGTSAILATSAVAFSVMKFAGAGYLIYLGFRAIWTKQPAASISEKPAAGPDHAFAKAVVAGVLNPKVAIFFLAFLPQFVDQEREWVFLQFLVLGSLIAFMDTVYESVLASIAGGLSDRLIKHQRFQLWRERVMGIAFIGLGLRLALTKRA